MTTQAAQPNPAADATAWSTRKLLAWILDAFTKQGIDEARRSAEILLEHTLSCQRLDLYTQPERPSSAEERAALRALVARALKGEPIQYLVGEWSFFGVDLAVGPGVLIPRPCTELIPEHVMVHARAQGTFGRPDAPLPLNEISPPPGKAPPGSYPTDDEDGTSAPSTEELPERQELRRGEGVLIGEVGTGTGCIPIAILRAMTAARAIATDISTEALTIAASNIDRHNLADRIALVQGDLLAPIINHPWFKAAQGLDYLVSNPPYIPDAEWNDPTQMGQGVKAFEPESALRGGPDGLSHIRPIIQGAPSLLRPGGLLLIEHAASCAQAVLELARSTKGLEQARTINDLEGHPRVLAAIRSA